VLVLHLPSKPRSSASSLSHDDLDFCRIFFLVGRTSLGTSWLAFRFYSCPFISHNRRLNDKTLKLTECSVPEGSDMLTKFQACRCRSLTGILSCFAVRRWHLSWSLCWGRFAIAMASIQFSFHWIRTWCYRAGQGVRQRIYASRSCPTVCFLGIGRLLEMERTSQGARWGGQSHQRRPFCVL
jgi:hypothetical protein